MYDFYQTQNFSFRFVVAGSKFQVFTFWPIKVLQSLKQKDKPKNAMQNRPVNVKNRGDILLLSRVFVSGILLSLPW